MGSNSLLSDTGALSLLSDDEKSTISKVFGVVMSHEAFSRCTALSGLLHNTLSEPSTTYTAVDTFLARLASNASGTRDLRNLRDAIASVASTSTPATPNTMLATQLYQSATSLMDKVIERYNVAFPAIGPSAADTIPTQYSDSVRGVCAHLYYVLYQQLYTQVQNTGSSYVTSFPYMSLSSLENVCTRTTASILDAVSLYPDSDTVDDYIAKCYGAVYNEAVNTNIADPVNRELFTACFLPFFTFTYIAGFVATPTVSAANRAPRNATVRRIAILCVYEFQLYLLYTFYQLSAQYAPASRQTYELRMILDMNVTSVYDDEASQVQAEDAVKRMHEATRATFDKNNALAQLSRDVETARSSYNSIRSNELALDKQVRASKAWRIVWLVTLVLYLAAVVLSVCTSNPGVQQSVFGVSMLLAFVVVMVALVAVIRSGGLDKV